MREVPAVRTEVIGDCTLYLADCREVLAALRHEVAELRKLLGLDRGVR